MDSWRETFCRCRRRGGFGDLGFACLGPIVTVFSGRQYSDLPFEGEIPKELDGMVPAACGGAVAVCV
jgi:hypothetical protein